MLDKAMTLRQVKDRLRDGMTIGIGGWGPRRKPMALVREILRSPLKDLNLVCYGGPEAGMLCAARKVKRITYGFVSLDAIPVEPWFKKTREAGTIEARELDEGMLQWGLRAAGMRLPFLPTRVGLGTDVLSINPEFRTIRSPYEDGESLLAMPAIRLDVALIHVDRADRLGNTQTLGPDPYFDEQFVRAADQSFVSCESLVDRIDQSFGSDARASQFERSYVTGVVHAPFGAHPTSNPPTYGWDMEHFKRYCACSAEKDGWSAYTAEFIAGSEEDYRMRVGGVDRLKNLRIPVF